MHNAGATKSLLRSGFDRLLYHPGDLKKRAGAAAKALWRR